MPPKKEEPKGTELWVEITWLLAGLFFLYMLFARIQEYLAYYGQGSVESMWARILVFFFSHIWPAVKFIGAIVTISAMVGIWHSVRKLHQIVDEERAIYGPFPDELKAEKEGEAALKNEKWKRVITHINSNNPSDWRLAIIEADIILDELLRIQGYHGDTIGEMLKAVERSDMRTIDNAWEAHKVRNLVAHGGGDYDLTERDAKRTIALFESVFKEFGII
ncbi:hypothetical protein KW785_02150 [Candidatus Parcubacteria bacterium]|nr:hypothetical protein [Candidatus Parcubacteria bacterium]